MIANVLTLSETVRAYLLGMARRLRCFGGGALAKNNTVRPAVSHNKRVVI
jgi:hypothetical protein